MQSGCKRILGAAAAAIFLGTVFLSGTAEAKNGGRPYRLAMSGAHEFDNVGAPINLDGDNDRGTIELRLNPGQERLCWSAGAITLTTGEALPFAAHIHEAPAGVAGPVIIPLFGGAAGPAPVSYPTGTRCVSVDRALIMEIMHDPSAYYVNFHNTQHPGGVMRAQLG